MSAPGLGFGLGTEQSRLDCIAEDNWYSKGLDTRTVEYCGGIFSRFWKGAAVSRNGSGREGVMTPNSIAHFLS